MAFAENLTFFVSLAAPDDFLRVRAKDKKGKVVFAEIVEILKPSAQRAKPGCEYFGVCGGCDFQQMSYQAQLAAKSAIVKDCLTRIGKIDVAGEIEIIASPRDYDYRSRAQWHVDTRKQKIGYFKRHSHDIVDVENCPILIEELQAKLDDLRENLNWRELWAERIEIEAASANKNTSVYSPELVEPTSELCFETNGERYYYDAENFFQGNQLLIPQLIETALANAGTGDAALDLFCGVGLFALPLARKFKRVRGVEANPKAIVFARTNAERARLDNAEFYAQGVADFLSENSESLGNLDFVLLDPPRAGAEMQTIEQLLRLKPKRISYVSCDPATLARDLRKLSETYDIERIIALDLFPQTHHVETVTNLKIKSDL